MRAFPEGVDKFVYDHFPKGGGIATTICRHHAALLSVMRWGVVPSFELLLHVESINAHRIINKSVS